MTTASTRIVVFSILLHLLLQVTAAPFSAQDILDIFGNPFEDIKRTIFTEPKTTELQTSQTPKKPRKEDEADTKMIDVPPNTEMCTNGSIKDLNGVCRDPW